ncbi:DUF3290 domain-containing protein [Carnobacterium maltaromaticum]|uniref:DUF3290 domain-containing protein n=1 Tax=Carnobacterium maltaromaticum TaxID=2751 RepID=UPI00070546FA|nr:DUF3290 domain-containing protein [Carnobacterium maltaromaticum]KRN84071.1 hypothetical protein IV75_GL000777 [Carnobacterium maltaromaticum]MDT1943477.1 DUF3290 domain-containing protein [Carnobacterium maltaromaticum]MDT1998857.1 DUF3290 domain-containing protein [Carnobacterium maltaromaticum]TFJ24704.1 DUF3290 domain-containing protein [Carnobacterium maltaromaticum]TFJ30109.1 DUF3290 domain-containing protein [Carnobacterium maltaromaticum]
MEFYTFDYLVNQSQSNNYLKYSLIFCILLFLAFVIIKYMRNRIQTKYRDLSLILFLSLVFIIGVQFTNYSQGQSSISQSGQMVHFITQVAINKDTETKEISVNSTSLTDEMVIKLKNEYYQVDFNSDFSAYSLMKVHIVDSDIKINGTNQK